MCYVRTRCPLKMRDGMPRNMSVPRRMSPRGLFSVKFGSRDRGMASRSTFVKAVSEICEK